MRYLISFLLLATRLLATEPEAPAPQMPDQVTLTTGRVLRKVTVVRWEKDRVVLKHSGGADPIPFGMFQSPAPTELPAIRSAWEMDAQKADAEAKARQQQGKRWVIYRGVMGITGDDGAALPLIGMHVYILPPESAQLLEKDIAPGQQYELPKPITQTETHAYGEFNFSLPASQKFLLLAQSRRKVMGRWIAHEWRIPSDQIVDRSLVALDNRNLRIGNTPIVFADK